jgi:diguanylate cyclase (GGDEF)-like protein
VQFQTFSKSTVHGRYGGCFVLRLENQWPHPIISRPRRSETTLRTNRQQNEDRKRMIAVENFVESDIKLPSAPAIAVRIIDIVQSEDFSFSELGAVIQSDPALVTKILRLVNSGYYGIPQKIGSIETAIALLGVNAVKNIALSFTIPNVFKVQGVTSFDFDRFWRRSAIAAVAADLIARVVQFNGEEVFINALLQDIGIATIFTCRKDDYQSVLDRKAATGLPSTAVEREVFGFDHQQVGATLLQTWRLPETVYLPIRFHHDADGAPPQFRTQCNILRTADRISAGYHGSNKAKSIRDARDMLSTLFKLGEAEANALIDAVAENSAVLLAQLDINSVQMKPFSQILQEANAELSRLNLSYEMLVMEYKQSTEKAERLSLELQAANDRLRELVFRDGLTDLYNHRYFQETIEKEINRSDRYEHPFALIMFDIDQFKKINDTYGHQVGDLVLQAVSKEIAQITRKSDVLARYGGEEFVLILPETTLPQALIKAESYRSAIEKLAISVDNTTIRTTISLGVASYKPGRPMKKDELIEAADQALYASKQSGRNRISSV